MKDKFKTIWAHMRASDFGPEPLVVELHNGEVVVQTISSHDGMAQDGLFCEGSGKTLDEALDDFERNLDKWFTESEGGE